MKKKRLLDSYALLTYLKKEGNYQRVVELLSQASRGSSIIMNEVNVGECYYIIAKEMGIQQAEYFIETVLPNIPVKVISNSFDHIIKASRIKANYPISYADCFAVVTAIREKAIIVTGDPDFKQVKDLVEIEWL